MTTETATFESVAREFLAALPTITTWREFNHYTCALGDFAEPALRAHEELTLEIIAFVDDDIYYRNGKVVTDDARRLARTALWTAASYSSHFRKDGQRRSS